MEGNNNRINLSEILGSHGIITFDVGAIQGDASTEWKPVDSYCCKEVSWIHNMVSERYKAQYNQEPINYLYEYWERTNKKSNKEFISYSFSKEGYKNDNEVTTIIEKEKESKENYKSYDLIRYEKRVNSLEGVDREKEQKVREIIDEKFEMNEQPDQLQNFIESQRIFTKWIVNSFNAVLEENDKKGGVKYATLVLFRYNYDEIWHITYNAVIFSNNLSFLNDPVMNLVFSYISRGKYLNEIATLRQSVKKESVKSAKAAIMSRNMSHNLGSHVMAYLKQHLGSVRSLLNDKILSELIKGEGDLTKKLDIKSEDVALPFLVGLGHFISYLQERQDFIATIATDFIPYCSNVNFKDGLYDPLNPDKRYERHISDQSKETNLQIDNILLGNIIRSEGFGRPTTPTKGGGQLNDIILKFGDFNGDIAITEQEKKSFRKMKACEVSLPGGIVGRQAVFSIFENVIRNSAKHGANSRGKNLEITFDVYSKEQIDQAPANDQLNSNHLSLYDVFRNLYRPAADSDDLLFVTITDSFSFEEDGLLKIRQAIADGYIDEKGEMKGENKGIKEMRISAAWLRSIKEDSILGPEKYNCNKLESDIKWSTGSNAIAPILYARISKRDGVGHLQYIFCLPRPKKIAIISSRLSCENFTKNVADKIVKDSWGIFTPEKFFKERNISYEFILLDSIDDTKYNAIRRKVSSRILKLSDISQKGLFQEEKLFDEIKDGSYDADHYMSLLYQYLADYQNGSNGPEDKIDIYDKNAWGNIDGEEPKKTKGIVSIHQTVKNDSDSRFVYRTHYELEKNFNDLIDSLPNQIERCKVNPSIGLYFVEGITGHNSTDRLIRNETINNTWSFKHLHAMKEKIAIFDERIFSKVYGIEETDFDVDGYKGEKLKNRYLQYIANKQNGVVSCKKEGGSGVLDLVESIKKKKLHQIDNALNKFNEGLDAKSQFIKPDFNNYPITPISGSFMGTAFFQKGISIFTIIRSRKSEDNIFFLCGLKECNIWNIPSSLFRIEEEIIEDGQIKKVRKSYSICQIIASISWENIKDDQGEIIDGCLHIDKIDNSFNLKLPQFDKISIHQGLLDKLYEGFGIKQMPFLKEKLTKDMYEIFCAGHKNAIIEYKNEENEYKQWFLPGMSIHSGRSKPNKTDMPQQLPFIQYASIEHAVLDCKYSLVELLDFARYE
jgi:hypothetical protein